MSGYFWQKNMKFAILEDGTTEREVLMKRFLLFLCPLEYFIKIYKIFQERPKVWEQIIELINFNFFVPYRGNHFLDSRFLGYLGNGSNRYIEFVQIIYTRILETLRHKVD